ncbi:hypothetical protein GCM10009742_05130 [Kribbella karoonensis]|uniref:Uncharacterized protein n=1 Tax=Kribbella karoonensis TaxID=324851 RepID=A0ABP4NS17_9ACTN
MDISRLAPAYHSDGPFATVLLDVGRGTETGAQEQEIRVRDAESELARIGAPGDVRDLVGKRLAERAQMPSPVSRAVVANRDGVVFEDIANQQVAQAVAWGPLPDLAGCGFSWSIAASGSRWCWSITPAGRSRCSGRTSRSRRAR